MNSGTRKLAIAVLLAAAPAVGFAADVDWRFQVSEVLGKPGTRAHSGIYRVSLPRTDLNVTLDGLQLKPSFALGGWLAFEKMGTEGVVMGDLVMTEGEVNPVMTKLAAGGIEVTALHNRLLHNRPFTIDVHVAGHGDPVKLAAVLHTALAESKTPLSEDPTAQQSIDLDTAAIDRTLGAKGTNIGGVYQFSIPRAEPIEEGSMVLPPEMGTANAINFQPTGGGRAAITGDFVLIAKEVNPVLKALRDHGIEVTAIHHHMLDDQPHLYFMHFWANDDVKSLAEALKATLAHINVAKS